MFIFFTDRDPAGGSDQEVFEISRGGSGRVRRFSNLTGPVGSGRVGSGSPEQIRPTRKWTVR